MLQIDFRKYARKKAKNAPNRSFSSTVPRPTPATRPGPSPPPRRHPARPRRRAERPGTRPGPETALTPPAHGATAPNNYDRFRCFSSCHSTYRPTPGGPEPLLGPKVRPWVGLMSAIKAPDPWVAVGARCGRCRGMADLARNAPNRSFCPMIECRHMPMTQPYQCGHAAPLPFSLTTCAHFDLDHGDGCKARCARHKHQMSMFLLKVDRV